ncbi:hypothetical protein PTKIN_Ptkin14bG0197800 [Pterospermum kingtungense]
MVGIGVFTKQEGLYMFLLHCNMLQNRSYLHGGIYEYNVFQALLDDSEEQQMKYQYWLADLKELAYDVDDILDQFSIQAFGLKLTLSEEPQAIGRKLMKDCKRDQG